MKKSKRTRVGMSEHLRELAIRDNSIKSLRAKLGEISNELNRRIIQRAETLDDKEELKGHARNLSIDLARERGINDALIKLVNGD